MFENILTLYIYILNSNIQNLKLMCINRDLSETSSLQYIIKVSQLILY